MNRQMRRALKRAKEKEDRSSTPMRLLSDPRSGPRLPIAEAVARARREGNEITPLLITSQLQAKLTAWREAGQTDMVDKVMRRLQEWLQILRKMPPGAMRAKMVHEHLDELIAKARTENAAAAAQVSCKKGCSACCNIQVMISEDEADLLYAVIRKKGIDVDVERLRWQSTWQEGDYLPNFWSGKGRCALLDPETKMCRVYEDRPMACRSYFVASPAELCGPGKDDSVQDVLTFFLGEAAIFETAAVSVGIGKNPEKHRVLPALLLERIERGASRSGGREGDARRGGTSENQPGVPL